MGFLRVFKSLFPQKKLPFSTDLVNKAKRVVVFLRKHTESIIFQGGTSIAKLTDIEKMAWKKMQSLGFFADC